jgi:hypothetical protein
MCTAVVSCDAVVRVRWPTAAIEFELRAGSSVEVYTKDVGKLRRIKNDICELHRDRLNIHGLIPLKVL